MFFDFVDGGSYSERTRAANLADFGRWNLRPRVLVDIASRDLSTTVLGERLALPLILGPTGFAGLLARRGEEQAARAAKAANIPFTLSTASICRLEDVSRAAKVPWFNLYVMKDRGISNALIDRAASARCPVLVVTVDGGALATREADVRNDFRSVRMTPRRLLDFLSHPGWAIELGLAPRLQLGNLAGLPGVGTGFFEQSKFMAMQTDPCLDWHHIAEIRTRWGGKLVLKGIMSANDALKAADVGADAIVVSNHGGRQLDGAPSSIRVLPEIAGAVGERIEILFDGGVRRGQHIVTALALGARACLIGRPWNYGLAADGEAGVARVIELLRAEFDITLGLMGLTAVSQLYRQAETCLSSAS